MEKEVVATCAGGLLTFGSYVRHFAERREDVTVVLVHVLGADERAAALALADRLKEET